MDLDPEIYDWNDEHWWLKEYGGHHYNTGWPATNTIWDNQVRANERCYRSPRTTQERRANQPTKEEPKLYRGRRGIHQLVNKWDDQIIHKDKSWKSKSKRRHQWKRIKQM
jgi:hypothetical protein